MKTSKYILFILIVSRNLFFAQEVKLFNELNSPLTPFDLSSLAIDSSNTVWVGTRQKELLTFNGNWNTDTTIWDITEMNSVDDIQVSPNGTIWLGISDFAKCGLYYNSQGNWNYLDYDYGLYLLGDIFIENDTTIYYSLINSWTHELHNDQIAIFAHDSVKTINYPCVNNVIHYLDDTLLVASCAYGITKFDGDSSIVITPEGWEPFFATKSHNQIFVFGERLNKYENGYFIDYPKVDSVLSSDTLNVTSLAIEGKDILWIGTDKGKLIRYNKNIEIFALSNYAIRDISIDNNKNKWFISYDGCFVFNEDEIVKVDQEIKLPKSYFLSQNYPNPFNPTTVIQYSVPKSKEVIVTLKVYDVLGNEVATLVNTKKKTGNYQIKFDAGNLSSGVYFYKFTSSNFIETKKMLLLK